MANNPVQGGPQNVGKAAGAQVPSGGAKASEQQNLPAAQPAPAHMSRGVQRAPSYGGVGGSPFSLMRRMMEDMERVFEGTGFGGFGRGLIPGFQGREDELFRGTSSVWAPQLDVFQRGNELVVRADLPGIKKEDLRIELAEDGLVLEGERRSEHEERREGFYRSERTYGTFRRVIPLPPNVDVESARAEMKDGVLEISLTLPEQVRGRRIEISEGTGGGGGQSIH